jgi:hypothetical protein
MTAFTQDTEHAALVAAWIEHRRAFRRLCERTGSLDAAVNELNSHLTIEMLASDLKQIDPEATALRDNLTSLVSIFRSEKPSSPTP